MASQALRKAGLAAAGFLVGLLLVALGLYLYLRAAQVGEMEALLEDRLQLPPEALELEEISPEGRLRIALRDVLLVGERGDTVAVAPQVSLWFDPQSLAGSGPIVLSDVVVRDPDVRLVQSPAGEWNLFQALQVRSAGREVQVGEEGAGRAVLLRDVEIRRGRLAVAIPVEPVDTASFAAQLELPDTRLGGRAYRVFRFRDVNATLPAVRLGGERGWQAEVADLDANLVEPALRIDQLRMRAAAAGEDAVRLEVDVLRFGASELAGGGVIRFTDAGAAYDVQVEARPLAFADLRALLPTLPADGQASFALQVTTGEAGRTALAFEGLAVEAPGARFGGRLGMVVGAEAPPTFRDTRLEIARLELDVLERLGLVREVPLRGTVQGTLATVGDVIGAEQGALQVNLTARLVPRGQPDAAPSVVTAVGGVGLGGAEAGFRMDDLRLQLEPLRLATLAELMPEQRDRLRGVVRGGVTVSGTPAELQLSEGDLVYAVGDAGVTRLAELGGEVALRPRLRYRLEARAQPLALSTLTELFPALPFRTATLNGPIRVTGTPERVELSADLAGSAGAIQLGGSIALGAVPRFDLSGQVETFNAAAVLRGELPVEGAVSGTFALNGTAEDLNFNVDLAQTAGRFALRGRLLRPAGGGAPLFTVAGSVERFRLGALIGRPGLFPEPVTGRIDVRGGGDQPYRFDLDLRGERTAVDLEGYYVAGAVPAYRMSGLVTGLNLARLPFGDVLPATDLNGRILLEGRGATLETLAGTLAFSARGSTVSGTPLDAAEVRASVADGVLRLDTLGLVLRDIRVSAEGTLGLTRPAGGRLDYRLAVTNLATVPRVLMAGGIQPDMAGSLYAQGWVSGSVRSPEIAVALRGQGLRYDQWRADQLVLDAQISRTAALGWAGEAEATGQRVRLASGETFDVVRFQANGTQQQLALGLVVRRDAASELALSGVLELEGRTPRGVLFESLALQYDGGAWELVRPARIRWGGVDGVLIENLLLRRTDGGPGLIQVEGTLPPTGTADLLVRAEAVDLSTARYLVSNAPDIEGTLSLEAVLEGPVSDPEMSVQALVSSLRYQGAEADSVVLSGRYDERSLVAAAEVWSAGQRLADVDAEVPMVLALNNLLPSFELLRDQPVFAQAVVDSLDVALLTAAIPQLAEGQGRIAAQTTVRGTLERPLLQGWAQLYNGAVRVVPLGVRYEQIGARLFLEENAVLIDSLSVYSDGTATVTGTVRFASSAGPEVYLLGSFQSFEAMDQEEVARVQLTGQLALSGQLPGAVLSGSVAVLESTFNIPEIDEPTGTEITDVDVGQIGADTLQVVPPGTELLAGLRISELTVDVGEDVWLVSEDARIQIGGELLLNRVGEDLRVFGALQALRGTYQLEIGPLVREFEIVRGQVQFFGTGDLNPELDILAANRIRTVQGSGTQPITVLVNITGTVQFPRIQLTSDTRPPLPESEILSLLLFGRPSFELGAGAARSLAEGVLAQEALVGLFTSPLERIFLRTGLIDYVNVRSVTGVGLGDIQQSLRFTTVEVGTELSDDVFLSVECGINVIFGGNATCGTRLQFDLGRNFTATAAYEPLWHDRLLRLLSTSDDVEYQASVQLRRRWEFGITDTRGPLEGLPAVTPNRE